MLDAKSNPLNFTVAHTAEFHKVPLLESEEYTYDTKLLTFGLPQGVSLDLPVSSCLLVQVSVLTVKHAFMCTRVHA